MRPAINFIKEEFQNSPLIGAEIGVYKGEHAEIILKFLNIKKLYLIDIWEEYYQHGRHIHWIKAFYSIVINRFKNNKKITIWKKSSIDASKLIKDESLDFIYIDANHEYQAIKNDINVWFPKIKKGGILAGHDYVNYRWPAVVKAVNEFIKKTKYKLIFNRGDWWIIK